METLQSDSQNRRWIPWTEQQRRFTFRSVAAAVLLFLTIGFFASTHRFFEKKFFIVTGEAEWIWVMEPMRREQPVAAFFSHDFEVPVTAGYVKINVAADPAYTLYFNGTLIGRGDFSARRSIDAYDVTTLKRPGKNRIVVAVRSEKGSGGLIASVDFGPMSRNMVVSNKNWSVHQSWSSGLLAAEQAGAAPVRSFGVPPVGRWNFPPRVQSEVERSIRTERRASGSIDFDGSIPETRILSGVAVASVRHERAHAFDFSVVEGQALLRRAAGGREVVLTRFVNSPEELEQPGEILPVVFAEGETEVVDPTVRAFRYIIVYGSDAVASVLEK